MSNISAISYLPVSLPLQLSSTEGQAITSQHRCPPVGSGISPVWRADGGVSTTKPLIASVLTTLVEVIRSLTQMLIQSMNMQRTSAAPASTTPSGETTVSNGSNTSTSASTDVQANNSSQQTLAKSGEFTWEPTAAQDGAALITIPAQYTDKIKGVRLLRPDGKRVLGWGTAVGKTSSGNEQYRLRKTGDDYSDGALVRIELKDGKRYDVKIADTAARFTW